MARLSCLAGEEMWFANVATYGDMGPFLCIISLVALILYFVTSSDSGNRRKCETFNDNHVHLENERRRVAPS